MSKKLRENNPIYIAPEIKGWLERGTPVVKDEREDINLNPLEVTDKIKIYERQVNDWFLNPATKLLEIENNGFIVLMICLSYLEGVEQYRTGLSTAVRGNSSKDFFVSTLERIYSGIYEESDLKDFYDQARCGLFHNGMVKGKIIINYNFRQPLEFPDSATIKVNPKKLLNDIKNDFANFLNSIRDDEQTRNNFNVMYSNV